MKYLHIVALLLLPVTAHSVIMPVARDRNAYVFKKDYEDMFTDREISKLVAKNMHEAKVKIKLSSMEDDLQKFDCEYSNPEYYRQFCENRDDKINPETRQRLSPHSDPNNPVITPPPSSGGGEGSGDGGNGSGSGGNSGGSGSGSGGSDGGSSGDGNNGGDDHNHGHHGGGHHEHHGHREHHEHNDHGNRGDSHEHDNGDGHGNGDGNGHGNAHGGNSNKDK